MEKLFETLNIKPKSIELYKRAFSHSSYVNEHHLKQDYERLEFLGDAVVDLVVADYLYSNKNKKEGEMTKIRASYVCENALYEYAQKLNLSSYIKVGQGELSDGGKYKKAIVADIFEAMIGAIYIDLGYITARSVLLNIIVPYIEDPDITFFSDYKSTLQEYIQTEQKSLHYDLVEETGPAHNKRFTIAVKVDDIVYGMGTASSKKEAEQEAAKSAIEKLAMKEENNL